MSFFTVSGGKKCLSSGSGSCEGVDDVLIVIAKDGSVVGDDAHKGCRHVDDLLLQSRQTSGNLNVDFALHRHHGLDETRQSAWRKSRTQ